jgi:signal transduction histidine kinase
MRKVGQLAAVEVETVADVGPAQSVSRWWEAGLDAVAALAVIVQLWRDPAAGATVAAAAVLVTALAAVVLRRRHTVAAVLIVTGVSAGGALIAPDVTLAVWVLAQVCLFSVPLRRPRVVTLAATAGLGTVLFTDAVLRMRVSPLDPVSLALVGWTAAVAGGGLTLRAQRDYLDAVRQQARAAVVARDSAIGRRVTEERLRIARDLHDAVAHNIAVISLHAGAADHTVANRTVPAPPGSKPGFGLIGMRERVTSAGGTLDTRRGADRFELIARLPIREHHEEGN